ncbi:IGF-like family receptor 1 isoform X1 [Mastacembelus armatus]|uniref:IGF-like family receptor 1 isoform X1 n=2 Tax=Mastacembelus armatus TaxID=205130 RepID=UPI000E4571EE|nr:IGF-like family receptor 1 isoform X1 [Mastacembelus armatus]
MMIVFFVYLNSRKRKRVQQNMRTGYERAADNNRFSQLSSSSGSSDLETVLSPYIKAAPLQTVLDNIDVLEELVMLLDPECHGAKNTKHLASYCSFSSTWITYTYSLKDSKSPLKAVLEGVTAKNPDWTVGHLAELLRMMERNDALAVLAKLRLNTLSLPSLP